MRGSYRLNQPVDTCAWRALSVCVNPIGPKWRLTLCMAGSESVLGSYMLQMAVDTCAWRAMCVCVHLIG